jgi:hypothetical protein
MRIAPKLLAAGVAAAALAGVAAVAQTRHVHVLTIRLPGGAVEQLRYSGDATPRVTVDDGRVPIETAASAEDFDVPFAALEHIQAQMEREMDAMLAGAPMGAPTAVGTGQLDQLQRTGLTNLPPGVSSYSVVSTFSGGHACTRTTEVTSQGAGKSPQVVSRTSGDCGAAAQPAKPGGARFVPDPSAPKRAI